MPEIIRRLPERIATYYEPFVGGAAVFFALAAEEEPRFQRAVLADRNRDLIDVYKAIQQDVEGVIRVLSSGRYQNSEEAYYRIRAEKPRRLVERAARVIYLNKTGYNGLYRVNSKGEFNVPFGRYAKPNICDAPRLRAVARLLQNVELRVQDFEEACRHAGKGDAVYLDPPYLPLSRTANFASYHHEPFGIEEHQRLARVFGELAERGVWVLLSNSDTKETRAIFGDFKIETVRASRAINSNAERRGKISEILVSVESAPARRKSTVRPRRLRA